MVDNFIDNLLLSFFTMNLAHMILPYGDDMSYSERAYNVILSLYDWYYRSWVTLPKQNEIAQRFFGHLASV